MLVDKQKAAVFNSNLDALAIKTLKLVGVEMVVKAKSGHPGVVISLATMLHTLVTRHLVYDPTNTTWINRDRVIFSGGHASALIYTFLHFIDLFSAKELSEFRQLFSMTSGHPELDVQKGIEATTGPLGQGIANGVGLAVARAHINSKFPELDHYIYVFCGDGDLQEGVAWEAMSFAGTNQLKKLILLYDSNDVQLDDLKSKVVREDLKMRCEAIGWDYLLVEKNAIEPIDLAITKAKKSEKPVLIEIKTIIGEGLECEGSAKAHGTPPSREEFLKFCQNLDSSPLNFNVSNLVKNYYKNLLASRVAQVFRPLSIEFERYLNSDPRGVNFQVEFSLDQATRIHSRQVNNFISQKLPIWIGGSADVASSSMIYGADGDFSKQNYSGRNLMFGVREFAMAAIANGIALHSVLRPFVSTFLMFSDYLKPALRLSAFMKLSVTYVFSHDSVLLGQDGPTHQPIEQLASLRSIPNVVVLRPADEKETQAAFELALEINKPVAIITSREPRPSLKETSIKSFKKGFYYVLKTNSEYSILATGSELALALEVGSELGLNVISAGAWRQEQKPLVNPQKTFVIEAASSFGWHKFATTVFCIDSFGLGGPGNEIYKYFGFSKEILISKIKAILEQEKNA